MFKGQSVPHVDERGHLGSVREHSAEPRARIGIAGGERVTPALRFLSKAVQAEWRL